jgi:protein subunit release factor B
MHYYSKLVQYSSPLFDSNITCAATRHNDEMMLARWTYFQGAIRSHFRLATRAFTTSAATHEKALPPRRKILDNEITEAFLRGTGPGGQKINKTSCAVQLKHLATGIVVKSQHTRSREQNRKYARLLLGERLDELEKGEDSRTAIKMERARVKKASANKKSKRKYKKLDEAKAAADGSESVVEGDGKVALDDLDAVSEQSPEPSQSNDVSIPEKSS